MISSKKNLFIFAMLLSLLASCATRAPGQLKQKSNTEKKAELYYDYGTNALVAKDYTKALTNLKKAVSIIDDDSRFHNNLGMAYFFKGDYKKAIHHLNESIDLDEKNSDAKNNLASVYFDKGEYEKAEKLYRVVLKDLEYAKQFRVYYNLGLLAKRKNKINQATAFFRKAVELNKTYCPAQYELGLQAYQSHNYHQASTYFQNAYMGSCGNNPAPYYQEAVSLFNLGEDAKALLKFKEIIEKFPTSKEAILANRKIKTLSVNSYRKNQRKILESKMRRGTPSLDQHNGPAFEPAHDKERSPKPVKALQF